MVSRQKADASEASVDGFVKFRQDYVKHCKDSKALWRNHGWDRIPFDAFIARVEALEEAGDSNIFGAFPMYNDIKNMNQIPVDILFRDFELRKWCKMVVQERDRAETNPTDPVFETFIDPANRKLLLMRVGSDLLMSYPYRTVSRLQLPQTWLDLSKAVMVWKRGFDDYVLEPYGPTYTEWSDDASYEQVIEDCRRNAWLPPSKALASTAKAEGGGSSGNRGRASSSCAGSVAGSSTSSPARTRKSGKKDDDAYRAWKKEQNAAKRARREARKAEESAVAQDEEWMR